MNILKSQFPSIEQVTDQYLQGNSVNKSLNNNSEVSFKKVLNEKKLESYDSVKFSKHAVNRLNDRNIELSGNQLDRLYAGTQMAGKKGINESLVLVDELAFIVNVKNKVVVTAIDKGDTNDNVFTNIDGAVIA